MSSACFANAARVVLQCSEDDVTSAAVFAWLVLNAVGDVGEGTGGDAGARHETHALVRLSDCQLQRRLFGKTVRLCKHITR